MDDTTLEAAVSGLDMAAAVRLLTGSAMFELAGEESIGLAPMVLSDGPTGVRGNAFVGGREAALLPNATLLSSAWDLDTAELTGAILAEEARAQGVHVVLGPTVNLHRTPLGGRLFEAFAEDPLLTGLLAAGYVRGIQAGGVSACVKHFVANEAETQRHTVDSRVDERALREIYLLPFEIAVADGGAWSVMAAYNRVNGVPATEHDELVNGVLKTEWGFDGVVMSDWFATTSTAASAGGGLDLVMPGPSGPWGAALVAAVQSGEVPESTVREHLRRVLRLAARVGVFATGVATPPLPGKPVDPAGPTRRGQLRRLAAAGMTVLTGGADVLPVDPARCTSRTPLLVVGRHALATVGQGGGSARLRPPHQVSIADGLRAAVGADRVRVLDGVEIGRPDAAHLDLVRDPESGSAGIRITSRRADGARQASTLASVASTSLNVDGAPHDGAASLGLAARLDLASTTEVEVGVMGIGTWVVELDGVSHEVVLELDEDDVGAALFGPPWWTVRASAGPDSRLVATLADATRSFGMVGLLARPAPAPDHEAIATAAREAAGADPAVVVVGLTAQQETETRDKTTLGLPGAQDELVAAVARAANRTIVVVNAATPVLMPWLSDVDAVLWAGLPGQEAGHAVADVLLGAREATGRLVTTFPAAEGQGPAWSPVPTDGVLEYTEGVRVGYRGWHGSGQEPLFWFGHGLGWTTWAYLGAQPTGPDQVTVEIENTGSRTGREVVQVYVVPDDEPVRLAGWAVAADVGPRERRAVRVHLDRRVLRRWTGAGWQPLPGGRLLVARGLGDVRIELDRPVG